MRVVARVLCVVVIMFISCAAVTAEETQKNEKTDENQASETVDLQEVVVTAPRRDALPAGAKVPAPVESITKDTIECINMVGTEDIVKYQPNVQMRRLFPGSRSHGDSPTIRGTYIFTPRTMVFADGIMLSNPSGRDTKWVMVAPEEIERVDIIYGPYSALYGGNAIGGVVLLTTELPDETEITANTSYIFQNYRQYKTDDDLGAYTTHLSYGDKFGKFHIFGLYDRLESEAYPVSFATQLKDSGGAPSGNTVYGWDQDQDRSGADRYILGSYGYSEVTTDLLKLRLAYDFNSYTQAEINFGYLTGERNIGDPETYLTDSAGNKVYSGTVDIDGQSYTISDSQFYYQEMEHEEYMTSISFKSEPDEGLKTWATFSLYDMPKETTLRSTEAPPASSSGGAGQTTDAETGWYNFDIRASYNPSKSPILSKHTFTAGYRYDWYYTDSETWITSDWKKDIRTSLSLDDEGKTSTHAIFFQDEWEIADNWILYLGGRYEWWKAFDGAKTTEVSGSMVTNNLDERSEDYFSPKAAITYLYGDNWSFRFSAAKAYRFPSVRELFYGSMDADGYVVNSNPDLKCEDVFSMDFTITRALGNDGRARLSFFHNKEKDSIFSQTNIYTLVKNYQNIDEVRKLGVEFSVEKRNFLVEGLGAMGSITYTDAEIVKNTNYPDSEGKSFPRVPEWTVNTVLSYSPIQDLSIVVGGRYASKPYGDLDNSDTVEGVYGSYDSYLVFDTKIVYTFLKNWKMSLGVDNITDELYHNSHPYPRRTYSAMLEAAF
nr:TonB-dependent receptor [uncultured Desulfobacter sp.]